MAGKRKAARRTARGARPAAMKALSLNAYLARIKALHAASPASERGACLVKESGTGQTICIRTSPELCKALNGTFLGGPCG